MKPERHDAKRILERIHCDVAGPFSASRSGFNYFVIFVDEMSKYVVGFPMKSKDEAPKMLKAAILEFEKLAPGHRVLRYRSDNATELKGAARAVCDEHKIVMEQSAPYSPFQNGISERNIRTITETIRCLLHQGNMTSGFWEDAFATALYVKNRVGKQRTPLEDLAGVTPGYENMRAFGCIARAATPCRPQAARENCPVQTHWLSE